MFKWCVSLRSTLCSYPGLVPENEVITTCVIFFVMGLVIEMFTCSNGVFRCAQHYVHILGYCLKMKFLPLYLISLVRDVQLPKDMKI